MSEVTLHERLEDVPEDGDRDGAAYVVIDVILGSTTIVHLLDRGAAEVVPLESEDAAFALRDERDDIVLVGESGGYPIEGFDTGPLPSAIDDHDVADRPVGILTTNGTRAVHRVGTDAEIYVGSTVNAAAVADRLEAAGHDEVHLVAAGRYGDSADEDTVGAELIRDHLRGGGPGDGDLDVYAERVRTSDTAEWLAGDLGVDGAVEHAVSFDATDTVPRLRDGAFVAD